MECLEDELLVRVTVAVEESPHRSTRQRALSSRDDQNVDVQVGGKVRVQLEEVFKFRFRRQTYNADPSFVSSSLS
jgi:hypothetical protein